MVFSAVFVLVLYIHDFYLFSIVYIQDDQGNGKHISKARKAGNCLEFI